MRFGVLLLAADVERKVKAGGDVPLAWLDGLSPYEELIDDLAFGINAGRMEQRVLGKWKRRKT